jgi:rhodanese-related sulfurtransferase
MATPAEIAAIRKAAAERATRSNLPYAGALTPAEAYALLQVGAKLVDVRTRPELLYVGAVPGSIPVEWQTYPGNVRNPDFLAQLAQAVAPGDTLMFLCRSGVRSHHAAAASTAGRMERLLQRHRRLRRRQGRRAAPRYRGRLAQGRPAVDPRIATHTQQPRPGGAGGSSGVEDPPALYGALQVTRPLQAVASTMMPKAMRYHANGRKSCVAT